MNSFLDFPEDKRNFLYSWTNLWEKKARVKFQTWEIEIENELN